MREIVRARIWPGGRLALSAGLDRCRPARRSAVAPWVRPSGEENQTPARFGPEVVEAADGPAYSAECLRQANGTVRRLCLRPEPLTNLRGTTLVIDGTSRRWLSVVVLDHPEPPDDFTPALSVAKHPAVALLRRDWEFLFDQLKSTHAVVQYFERIAGEEVALGDEPVRYDDLARADAGASPSEFPKDLLGPGVAMSAPLLPIAPAASDDQSAHQIVRAMLEDIALTRLTTSSEEERVRVLAELDRLPVSQRAAIGRVVLGAMATVSEHRASGVIWQMRSVRGEGGRTHLGFGACSHPYMDTSIRRVAAAFCCARSTCLDRQGMIGRWSRVSCQNVCARTRSVPLVPR